MKVLFWGSALFCLAFSLHLIIWKVRIPERQIKVVLQIFFGTFTIAILTLWAASSLVSNFNLFSPKSLLEYLHISFFFVSLTLAYITTYSAVEVDSPSLVMIMIIANAGRDGLDEKQFAKTMTDDLLVTPRVKDLILDKMVYLDGNKYRLTPRGLLLAHIFIFYRRILNAGKGG